MMSYAHVHACMYVHAHACVCMHMHVHVCEGHPLTTPHLDPPTPYPQVGTPRISQIQ